MQLYLSSDSGNELSIRIKARTATLQVDVEGKHVATHRNATNFTINAEGRIGITILSEDGYEIGTVQLHHQSNYQIQVQHAIQTQENISRAVKLVE